MEGAEQRDRCAWSGSTRTCSAPTGTGATCSCLSGAPGCAASVWSVVVRQLRPAGAPGRRHLPAGRRGGPAAGRSPPGGCARTVVWPRRPAGARWCSRCARAISCSVASSAEPTASRSAAWASLTCAAAGVSAGRSGRSWRTSTPRWACPALTGFENHQGVTRLGPEARLRWRRCLLGIGNGDGTEGALRGPGARHLPARPGPGPQPGPGRPAARLDRWVRCGRCLRPRTSWPWRCAGNA